MAEHTATPYDVLIYGTEAAGIRIGDITIEGAYYGGESDHLSPADARFIVLACNHFEEMREALEAFQEWSEFPAMKDIFKKYGMQNVAQQVLSKLDGAQ